MPVEIFPLHPKSHIGVSCQMKICESLKIPSNCPKSECCQLKIVVFTFKRCDEFLGTKSCTYFLCNTVWNERTFLFHFRLRTVSFAFAFARSSFQSPQRKIVTNGPSALVFYSTFIIILCVCVCVIMITHLWLWRAEEEKKTNKQNKKSRRSASTSSQRLIWFDHVALRLTDWVMILVKQYCIIYYL